MREPQGWLTWVAAYGLSGAMVEPPRQGLEGPAWESFLKSVRRHQLMGLLWQAIDDNTFPASEQQRQTVAQEHIHTMGGVLQLEAQLLRAANALRARSIDCRVLKGSAVAHLDYPSPALRPFGDVDLLVRSEDIDAAVDVITELGFDRSFSEPRPGFDRRYGKGASFQSAVGWEIDLHRTFVLGPFGLRISLDDLWERHSSFTIGGVQLPALGAEERFLHSCYSVAISDIVPRLGSQRDVAQMLLHGQVERRRVRELATRWQAEAVVARAVRMTWQTLQIADITALSSWAMRYRPASHEQRDVALYTTPGVSYTAQSLAAVSAIPGLRPKAGFVLALSAPSSDFAAPARRGFTARLWKGVHDLADARRR